MVELRGSNALPPSTWSSFPIAMSGQQLLLTIKKDHDYGNFIYIYIYLYSAVIEKWKAASVNVVRRVHDAMMRLQQQQLNSGARPPLVDGCDTLRWFREMLMTPCDIVECRTRTHPMYPSVSNAIQHFRGASICHGNLNSGNRLVKCS